MKKIMILRVLIAAYITYNIIQILLGLYVEWQVLPLDNGPQYLNFTNVLISLIKDILLLPTLILLFQTVHYFIKRGYFNSRSAAKLKISGIILMVNSVIRYILTHAIGEHVVTKLDMESKYSIKWLEGLPMLFTLLIIGFGLYTLSDFIRRGEAIETENKLTI